MTGSRSVLAACGLRAEARVAAGNGVAVVAGGGDPARLALLLQAAIARGARAVISFGIAGGLEPSLRPGTVIIGRSVIHGGGFTTAEPAWVDRLAERLPHGRVGDLAGVDGIVTGAAGKRDLHRRTGALAVDMESHIAARLASQHRLPFAALRVVADPAHRSLPHAATVGMRPDGTADAGAVLRSLMRQPGDIPALLRTALDAQAAFAALRRSRRQLSSNLDFAEASDAVATEGAWIPEIALTTALQAASFGGAGEVPVEST